VCLIRRQDRTRTEAIPLSWSANCFPSIVNLNPCGLARRFYVGIGNQAIKEELQ